MKKTHLATLTAMLFSTSAMAASCGDTTAYDYDTQLYAVAAIGQGNATSSMGKQDSFTLTGGYRFNDKLAVEVSYAMLGKFALQPTVLAPIQPTVDVNVTSLSVFGKYPIDEWAHYSVFGRVGMSSTSKTFEAVGLPSVNMNKTSPSLGVGFEFSMGDSGWSGRISYDRFFVGELIQVVPAIAPAITPAAAKDKIDNLSVGVVLNF